jgi:hypothetical protein
MMTPSRAGLLALLGRFRDAQREIIFREARSSSTPGDNAVRKIADLENAIAAVEATVEEVSHQERRNGTA